MQSPSFLTEKIQTVTLDLKHPEPLRVLTYAREDVLDNLYFR